MTSIERRRARMRWARKLAAACVLIPSGCVFPVNLTSGVELTWFVAEVGPAGDDDERSRTCEGALMRSFVVRITDLDEPSRHRRFQYACEDGLQSPEDFVAQVSDAFLDLRAGKYRLDMRALGDDAVAIYEETREVKIEDQRARIVRVEITPEPVDLELDMRSLDVCDDLGGMLFHADAAAALADFEPVDETQPDAPVAYRSDLESDRGLRLDGDTRPCADLDGGVHTLGALDPGRYELHLHGLAPAVCEVPVVLPPGAGSVRITLDLANPPC